MGVTKKRLYRNVILGSVKILESDYAVMRATVQSQKTATTTETWEALSQKYAVLFSDNRCSRRLSQNLYKLKSLGTQISAICRNVVQSKLSFKSELAKSYSEFNQ